jgi:hypothetical protein
MERSAIRDGISQMVRYRRNFVSGGTYFSTAMLEWPYSSFHVYVRRGLLPADWAGDVEEPMMDFGERRG